MVRTTVRTTLSLPAGLLAAVDQAVRDGKARSQNELIARSIERELAEQERLAIDVAFAGMAKDRDYQEEAAYIAREFAAADWQVFSRGTEASHG